MKTLKNLFGTQETKKTMNSFMNELDMNAMLMVKGGEDDPQDDTWPPSTKTGGN